MAQQHIEIYTDGSCKGNPGPGGWAAIFLHKGNEEIIKTLKGSEPHTTNNRMEMLAMIEALHYLKQQHHQRKNITLYSDSNLIIQTILSGWKKKANLDLWKELDILLKDFEIDFVWVKGHAKNYWNNECDKIAQREATRAQQKI